MDLLNRDVWSVVARFLRPSTLGCLNTEFARLVFATAAPTLRERGRPQQTLFRHARVSLETPFVSDAVLASLVQAPDSKPSTPSFFDRYPVSVTSLHVFDSPLLTSAAFAHISATLTSLSISYEAVVFDEESLQLLPNLTSLSLDNPAITDRGLAVLATFGKLRVLQLGNDATRVTDAGLSCVASTLRELHLDSSCITDHGLRTLTGLTALALDARARISDAGLKTLSGLTSFVFCTDEQITDAGLAMFAKTLTTLRVEIVENPDRESEMSDIRPYANLRVFELSDDNPEPVLVEIPPELTHLTELRLTFCNISKLRLPKTLTCLELAFCESKPLRRVADLLRNVPALVHFELVNGCGAAIYDFPVLGTLVPNLTYLNLVQTETVLDESLEGLIYLSRLDLDKYSRRITEKGLERLPRLEYLGPYTPDVLRPYARKRNITILPAEYVPLASAL